ncbi:MAG: hypothetical protein R2757_00495 [Draconibacterium sp.]
MKKKNLKGKPSGFDSDYGVGMGKKVAGKDKSSKKRLSIYDDYEEDDDELMQREKFKNRHK